MKKSLSFILGLTALLAVACQRPGEIPGSAENAASTAVPVVLPEFTDGFQLELSVPGNGLKTYATVAPYGGEDDVNSLFLLFFEYSEDGTGKFIAPYEISGDLSAISSKQETTLDIKFANDSPLNKSTAYSILVIANVVAPQYPTKTIWGTPVTDWLSSFSSFTENEVIQNSVDTRSSGVSAVADYDTYLFNHENLLMSARVTREVGQSNVKVALTRLVSRFEVGISNSTGYDLASVSIWNVYPEISIWERPDFEYSEIHLKRFYGQSGNLHAVNWPLYAFENYVTEPGVNDEMTTCLIIGLKSQANSETYYYRQNITAYKTPQQLKRNNVYQVSIQRVNAVGASSELDAYQSEEVLLETIINTWNMGQNGEMLYNGESVMILPTSQVSFTAAAESRTYKVHTQGLGTLSISKSTLPEGLSATLDDEKQLTITATVGGADPRSGYVELAFGSLRGIINVNQEATETKYIKPSLTTIPVFPGSSGTTSEEIHVNSSGNWTAELYNVPKLNDTPMFAFGNTHSTSSQIAGVNGGKFTVSTTGKNTYTPAGGTVATEVVAFLLIQLDSDPTVRRVLMLTQKPTGGFTMGSLQKQLHFDALGASTPGSSNRPIFTVTTSDDDETWEVKLSGEDAQYFSIMDANGVNPLAGPITGNSSFRITASDNKFNKELNAIATVTLGLQSFEIKITQAKHVMSISPTKANPILVAGGTTEGFTVRSSATGKTWKATINNVVASQLASFSPDAAVTEITGQQLEGKFSVTFPKLEKPFIVPQAIVTVQMEGYDWLTTTLTVTQQSYQPRAITLQTAHSTYGRADVTGGYYNYFSAVSNGLRDKALFGPAETAKVRTSSSSLSSWPQNATVSNSSAILLINDGLNSTQRNNVMTWRNAHSGNMLIFLLDLGSGNNRDLLRTIYGNTSIAISDPGLTPSDWDYNANLAASGGNTAGREKLWKYLVDGDGPFGAVTTSNVKLTPRYDYVDNTITGAPSSLITLLTVAHNSTPHIQLAIDPAKNLIIVGNMDMFAADNNRFPVDSDNWKFLNNLLAYIVNAAQYGDVFLEQFR
jgi:hypothetical protein